MPYFLENDDLRPEVRDGIADTFYLFPKVRGENVTVAGTPTYEIYDPSGALIQSGSASTTLVDDVHRIDVSFSAITTRDEDYQLRVAWVPNAPGPAEVLDVIQFDVVAHPLDTRVSLNDLMEERPDVAEVLDRLGVLLGYTSGDGGGEAQREAASVFSTRALSELDAKLRDQVYQDAQRFGASYTTSGIQDSTRKYVPGNLILNRSVINRVLRKMAMRLVYAADMASPEESGDESAALFAFYDQEAAMAWASIGPLKYDSNDDLKVDDTIQSIGKAKTLTRVQG